MHSTLTGVVVAASGDGIVSWFNQLFIDVGTAVTNGVKVALILTAGTIIYKSANKVLGAVLAAVVAIFGWWAINNFDDTGISDKIDNETSMGQTQSIQTAPAGVDVVPGEVLHISPTTS